mmetsp:Transcript_25797/g.62153  ORF Transcript_25797/g.62153 Transcript_25797/m.62153 type:complete len:380 (+) Transcript_25797:517-1656(+)
MARISLSILSAISSETLRPRSTPDMAIRSSVLHSERVLFCPSPKLYWMTVLNWLLTLTGLLTSAADPFARRLVSQPVPFFEMARSVFETVSAISLVIRVSSSNACSRTSFPGITASISSSSPRSSSSVSKFSVSDWKGGRASLVSSFSRSLMISSPSIWAFPGPFGEIPIEAVVRISGSPGSSTTVSRTSSPPSSLVLLPPTSTFDASASSSSNPITSAPVAFTVSAAASESNSVPRASLGEGSEDAAATICRGASIEGLEDSSIPVFRDGGSEAVTVETRSKDAPLSSDLVPRFLSKALKGSYSFFTGRAAEAVSLVASDSECKLSSVESTTVSAENGGFKRYRVPVSVSIVSGERILALEVAITFPSATPLRLNTSP